MAKEITFLDWEPQFEFDRDCLIISVRADGKPITCAITAELLFSHFGARDFSEEALRKAYQEHLAEIQSIVRGHIENGWVDEESRVFLTTRFTKLTVVFDESLGEYPKGRAMAEAAHRVLLGLIGPNAESVEVRWSAIVGPPDEAGIRVQITDPVLKFSIAVSFGPKESADPTTLSVFLARVWSGLLRARSRQLSLQSG